MSSGSKKILGLLSEAINSTGKHSSFVNGNDLKVNVGSVLFTRADNGKTCWNYESVTLLSSRYIFQNLLPDYKLLKIKNNQIIDDVVAYFKLLLTLAQKSSDSSSRRLILFALADTIGGYLHRFVLPFARYAYYSGYINCEDMENLNIFFENIKNALKTNGKGWAEAHYLNYPTYSAEPLIIPIEYSASKNPCKRFAFVMPSSPQEDMAIPLPFTDSVHNPVSIILPYKSRFFFSLTSRQSKDVVVKYYVSSIKCLKYLNATEANVKEFNSNFMSWLVVYVMPNLFTDTFYPGFGGVFKIIQTMENNGIEPKQMDNFKAALEEQDDYVDEYEPPPQQRDMILYGVCITVLIWILLGCILLCCRMRSEKCQKDICKQNATDETEICPVGRSSASRSNTGSQKFRRAYGSSSDESKHKGEIYRKKRKDKKNFI
ncbi:hypothetical protein RN001_004281 [Aquatica leii]|uniref:Uncharacterized protein n=1 Tax=Aquatica leii TaxID=1421715 RepID=A0AAN7PAG6_9COLE|nr:hypothetical protein RN001_004281 [Aquatica leii]